MASRIAGAVLALTAAGTLAASVLATAWWSGHPSFKGSELKTKEITVGPLGGTGCNTGGDGACMNVPVDPTFETIGFAVAGVASLLAVALIVIAVLSLTGSPRRKTFAIFSIVGALLASGLAAVLLVVGPQVRSETPLPLDIGIYVFFGGVAAALAGTILTLRSKDEPVRMQLAPARQSLQQMSPAAASPNAGFDVRALLAEGDQLRPSQLGPEPMIGKSPVQSPGGMLPGPSGPLGAIGGSGPQQQQPLFSSAPQLRPLYEMPGQGGFQSRPSNPNVPIRPPTPIPRDQISALAGIPTPASIEAQRGPNPETDRDLLGIARGVGKPKTLPPPIRNKPPTLSPPITASVAPVPSLVPNPPPNQSSFVPPPPIPATPLAPPPKPNAPPPKPVVTAAAVEREETVDLPGEDDEDDGTFDAMKTYQQDPMEKPQPPPKPATPAPKLATPKPTLPAPPAAAKPPLPVAKQLPPNLRVPPPRAPSRLLAEDASVDTDVNAQAIDEHMPATESFETSTSESTAFAQRPRPPVSTTMEAVSPSEETEDDEAMTAAREKVSRTDLELPVVSRPPTATAQTEPAPEPPPTVETEIPKLPFSTAPEPPPTVETEKPKLPISTAPDSLPPPSEKQQATSGPSPACPQCEAPMAWVEAHLRFYCKSCKMYF